MSPEGGLTSIIDLCADKLAEETLVGGREKDREPHADEIVAVVEQFGRHLGVLSEIEPRIDHDSLRLMPAASARSERRSRNRTTSARTPSG